MERNCDAIEVADTGAELYKRRNVSDMLTLVVVELTFDSLLPRASKSRYHTEVANKINIRIKNLENASNELIRSRLLMSKVFRLFHQHF